MAPPPPSSSSSSSSSSTGPTDPAGGETISPASTLVKFKDVVEIASLPVEEAKDAWNARRGTWLSAPMHDELWDGERRVFWEKELNHDELKEILRFRRLARYASYLQGLNGIFGIKVPMPKPPPIVIELIRIDRENRRVSNPTASLADFNRISTGSIPASESPRNSHRMPHTIPSSPSPISSSSVRDSLNVSHLLLNSNAGAPPQQSALANHRASLTLSREWAINLQDAFPSTVQEEAESVIYTNPALETVTSPTPAAPSSSSSSSSSSSGKASSSNDKQRLSGSQFSAMQGVRKKIDVTALQQSTRALRIKKRAAKRRRAHAILQPWFPLVYFYIPLLLLSSTSFIPWLRNDFYPAWRENRAIHTAVHVPRFIERVLMVPNVAQTTVYVGLFAIEVTSLIYLLFLFTSHLALLVLVRPMLMSLTTSFSEKTAAEL